MKPVIRLGLVCLILLSLPSCRSRKGHTNSASAPRKELADLDIQKKLRQEIKSWMGVPYLYGGNDRKGVDCSGFVHAIYLSVYKINLPRTSKQMYNFCKKIKQEQLKEGDLVFFDYEGKGVSHVGIYLSEMNYAHASSSKGVVISSLVNTYNRKKYVGAGRVKQ